VVLRNVNMSLFTHQRILRGLYRDLRLHERVFPLGSAE
jgi:hypothetical protein